MKLRSVVHKGLRRFLEEGDPSGLPPAHVAKIEAMVDFLLAAPDVEAVRKLTVWRAHRLTGDRQGTWSLTVSRNWRLTFAVTEDNEIAALDFQDYH